MAVFPDRIVLKNSSDSNEDIRAAIEEGGPESITIGELVISTRPTNPAIYIKDSNGDIQTVAGGGGGGGGEGSQVIVKNTPPITAEDGSALILGDVWFNPLDAYLHVWSTDQASYLYYEVPFTFMSEGPWGKATADNSTVPTSFPYTNSLIINNRAEDDRIFYNLLPSYNSTPKQVWASIDGGAVWVEGTLKKGFYQASNGTTQFSDIIPGGPIAAFNWASAFSWRFAFQDPDVLGWVQVDADDIVRSVNDQTGSVSLGITDMDDYENQEVVINDVSPINALNSADDNGFTIGFNEYLDAQSTTTPTALPVAAEWTMFQEPGTPFVTWRSGNAPTQTVAGYTDWESLPDYNSSLQYYVQLTIYGPFPQIDGGEAQEAQVLKPFPIKSYTLTADGLYILWDLEQLNPTDIAVWGFSVDNPDRAATQPPLPITCTVRISPSLVTGFDTNDGDFLVYDAENFKWVASRPPVQEIADLLDVKRGTDGYLGNVFKYAGVSEANFFDMTSGGESSAGLASTEWPGGRTYLVLNYRDESNQEIRFDPVYIEKSFDNTGEFAYVWISINEGATWRAYWWKLDQDFFGNPFAVQIYMDTSVTIIDETVEHLWVTLLDPLAGAAYQQGDALLWDTAANAFIPQVIDIEPPPQSLNDLTDVNTASPPPTNNQALVYDALAQLWQPLTLAPPGSGGALIAQAVLEEQTTDIDGNALFQGLGFWGNLIQVQSDVDAWVTLYTTAASRTADLTRSFGNFAAPGSGTIAGFNLTAGIAFQATPAVPYFNNDVIKTGAIYALARDQSGTVIPDAVITINAYGAVRFTVISGGTFSGT